MKADDVTVSITMSNDRTVVNLTFAADGAINNQILADILLEHANVLVKSGGLQ